MTKKASTEKGAYWVWEMGIKDRKRPTRQVSTKPLPLEAAKQLARIGATEGKHDRAVSTNPRSRTFTIVAVYERGTGQNITQAFRANRLAPHKITRSRRPSVAREETPPSQYAEQRTEEHRYDPESGGYVEHDRSVPSPEPGFELPYQDEDGSPLVETDG